MDMAKPPSIIHGDLHTHTTASDGLLTPQDLLKEAEQKDRSHMA